MWIQEEDGIYTIGINEEGLADFESITSVELPSENESVEEDVVLGTIETDDGPLDVYSPVSGTVIEVNSNVLEDPSLIVEDPLEEGWLVKIEADAESDDDEDDEDDDDDDFDDEDEEEEDEE
jgi:glycine cleavage system H protein